MVFVPTLLTYSIIVQPSIKSISPPNGFIEGGTNVTITGSNFDNYDGSHIVCRFGTGADLVPAIYINNSTITCTSPNQSTAATVLLQASEDGTSFSQDTIWFSYISTLFTSLSLSHGYLILFLKNRSEYHIALTTFRRRQRQQSGLCHRDRVCLCAGIHEMQIREPIDHRNLHLCHQHKLLGTTSSATRQCLRLSHLQLATIHGSQESTEICIHRLVNNTLHMPSPRSPPQFLIGIFSSMLI